MPPVDPRSYKPKYVQVVDGIRDQITSGEYEPGDYLPSERDLAHEWEVSSLTARRALATLRAEGLIVTEQGVRAQVREVGERTTMRIHLGDEVTIRPATADEQRQFNLPAGAPVVVVTAAAGGDDVVVPAYEYKLIVGDDS